MIIEAHGYTVIVHTSDSALLLHVYFYRDTEVKTKIKYRCGRHDIPVYSCPPKHITTAEAMNILLDPNLDRARACSSEPVAVEQNRLFIVDLHYLKQPNDVLCDDMGSWVSNGNYTAWVMVDEEGEVDTPGKSLSEKPSEGMYVMYRK